MTDRARAIYDYLISQKQDFVQLLRFLVEEESPTDEPEAFPELWRLLKSEFENLGLSITHFEGESTAGQLICTFPDHSSDLPSQLILGHCDTVWSLGTIDKMPFSVDGNTIAGPGIFDMKAGLTMMIFSMKAISNLGQNPTVQPIFLITSDEETGSNESKDLIIEKANLAERTFVLEPALGKEGKIKTRRKGIGEFEIIIKGKPSHAGLAPEEGVSAILGLSQIVQKLFQLNDPSRGITVNVGTIEGGERSNVIAARSKAVVDVRVPTEKNANLIEEQIHGITSDMEGLTVEVHGGINRPPLEKNPANEKLWQLLEGLGHELGLELEEGVSGGASDGNFTNLYSPTIDGLGAVGDGAHAYHERIFLEETLKRTALFSLLLLQPAMGD